jgi:small subunit ribosomal protein S17
MERQIKNKTGSVIRRSGDKSVIVLVERCVKHPEYQKYIRKRKKFHAHDEKNVCQLGDKVRIIESRPISKTKRWKVAEVIAKGLYIEKGVDDTAKAKTQDQA